MASLAGAEVPRRTEAAREALPDITPPYRGFHRLVLWFLGIALSIVMTGSWIVVVFAGKPAPDSLPVIAATIVATFVGIISIGKKS